MAASARCRFAEFRSAHGGRRREEPGMPVEVAGGVAASVGFIARRMDDVRSGRARPFIVRIDISEIDEDTLRRGLRFVRAQHPPFLAALSHHDALSVERHLRVHATWRRMPHFLGKAKGAGEPAESRRNVAIKNVGYDLSANPWFRCTHFAVLS